MLKLHVKQKGNEITVDAMNNRVTIRDPKDEERAYKLAKRYEKATEQDFT